MAGRRRRIRFSLAALLIVITAASLWLGRRSYLTHRQNEAIQVITSVEGIVIEDEREIAPHWLRKVIGEEHFKDVVAVDFATNRGRKSGSQDPKVSDEALANLSSLADVEVLELSHNESVSDGQLKYLQPLRNLKTLYLYRTNVTGPGLAYLTDLQQLEVLVLGHTAVGDDGLAHVAKMPRLRSLQLENTTVTDAGVGHLSDLKQLETLSLKNTRITDTSVASLENLTGLKELVLKGTAFTEEGAKRLKTALPQCNLTFSFAIGKQADNEPLFPADYEPSAAEINAALKSRGVDGEVTRDQSKPGNPIVALRLFDTILAEDVILRLIDKMPYLEQVNLRGALVGDAFLRGLSRFRDLSYLSLKDTRVTDEGLTHLSGLTDLRELVLSDTAVTDAGLRHLRSLKNLQMLLLDGTKVSEAGRQELMRAIPGCTISL